MKHVDVEKFLKQHTTIRNPHPEEWTEAKESKKKLMQQSSLLRILWLSEPNEARYHSISDWITTIKDEVRTKLRALEVFIRARERRSPIRLTRASIHVAVHVAPLLTKSCLGKRRRRHSTPD